MDSDEHTIGTISLHKQETKSFLSEILEQKTTVTVASAYRKFKTKTFSWLTSS